MLQYPGCARRWTPYQPIVYQPNVLCRLSKTVALGWFRSYFLMGCGLVVWEWHDIGGTIIRTSASIGATLRGDPAARRSAVFRGCAQYLALPTTVFLRRVPCCWGQIGPPNRITISSVFRPCLVRKCQCHVRTQRSDRPYCGGGALASLVRRILHKIMRLLAHQGLQCRVLQGPGVQSRHHTLGGLVAPCWVQEVF